MYPNVILHLYCHNVCGSAAILPQCHHYIHYIVTCVLLYYICGMKPYDKIISENSNRGYHAEVQVAACGNHHMCQWSTCTS